MKKLLITLSFLCSFTLFSQSILTNGEVYDYEIGDEFQYSLNNYPGTMVERYTVIDKQFSTNSDTVFYTQSVSNYSNGPDGNGGTAHYYFEDTINFYITDLNTPATTFGDSIYIHDNFLDSSYYHFPDTIIEFDSNLCGLKVNGWESYPPTFEPNHLIRIVGKGVGSVWTYHFDPTSTIPEIENRKLYYYKKGNIECGTPNTASINFEQMNSEISIYPVPANSSVNVNFEKAPLFTDIQLFNLNGKQIPIELFKITNNTFSFDSENIPVGVYLIGISTKDTSLKRKIIITH